MNVINQVLNKLEKRGAHSAVDQDMVRTVPQVRGPGIFRIAALVVLAGAAIAVLLWQWNPVSKQGIAVMHAVRHKPAAQPDMAVFSAAQAASATVAATEPLPAAARAVVLAASAPQLATVKIAGPVIASLSPAPIYGSAAAQPLTIKGSGYTKATTVTLRTAGGKVYANRPVVSQTGTQIVINVKLGNASDSWTVELNDENGASSGEYAFTVQPRPAARAAAKAAVVNASPDKSMKQVSRTQQAEAEYHRAVATMQQGGHAAALKSFEEVLRLDAGHDAARQALVSLLLEDKRGKDAERVLQTGLQNKPEQTGLAMMLARVQVERGAYAQAIATLEKYLPNAENNADFRAFYAALLQRQKRHKEAIEQYQIALRQTPNNGVWMMGCGISLQGEQRNDDAKQMYQRALDSNTLNAELQAFVRQKLKEL